MLTALIGLVLSTALTDTTVREIVYVETSVDSDYDGKLDRLYAAVEHPAGGTNLPTIYTVSPYSLGGNDVPNHDVDLPMLPQGERTHQSRATFTEDLAKTRQEALDRGYATVAADSLGTGRSDGCPTVGDMAETSAATAVIDWLNGRARAFAADGHQVFATWANGATGMTGVSYNGTLPNMIATTGVEGLKAIIPVAAISSWYDYYRANGLVVGPGGYIGEDADVLGKYIVRGGECGAAMNQIEQTQGREHGDYSTFWQDRDYISKASAVRAAVFIMHGQSDWNVRQRHAIRWWEALNGHVPLRMWLHRGGHGSPSRSDTTDQMFAWFDRYVKGVKNGVEREAPVEVESPEGTWVTQQTWPSELTTSTVLYLNPGHTLAVSPGADGVERFADSGKSVRLESMIDNPTQNHAGNVAFVTAPLGSARLLSGTPKIQMSIAVGNRRAANLTVAIVDYDANGRGTIITRGWADPQNHQDMTQGEPLAPGQSYQVAFDLQPKQYTFPRGHRIGVVVAATDYDHTLRPDAGTALAVAVGPQSFATLDVSGL